MYYFFLCLYNIAKGVTLKKVSDDNIISVYDETKSIYKTATTVGLCPQSVHERLVRLGKNEKVNKFTEEDAQIIKEKYQDYANNGKLGDLAEELGRTKNFICRKAKELGLTNRKRKKSYFNVWNNMSEKEATSFWEEFKKSKYGLVKYCKYKNFGLSGFSKTMKKYFFDEWEHVMELKVPKTSKYKRGRSFEYRTRDDLKKKGFFVLRSPASRSPVDLIAIRKNEILCVQCKMNGAIGVIEWNKLLDLANSIGAIPILASIEGIRKLKYYLILEKKDGSIKPQPYREIIIKKDILIS